MSSTQAPTQNDVVKALMAMAVIYDKQMTEPAADLLVSDLAEYEPAKILAALRLCRLELNRFPTTAEIIKRMSIKSEAGQAQELVGTIFKAVAWYGYTNPAGAREMIGEVGWKGVEFFGGWKRLCDSPEDEANIVRAQIRKAVESAVEEKTRCDVLGIPFEPHTPANVFQIGNRQPLQKLDFGSFLPDGDQPA
jgi:hypothetical protein